jgi:tRNA threonylcarbamoyladenosine biosynthesis protein TsaE
LYRLKSTKELFEIGFEDYLQSNNYVLIEWPELAMPFIDKYIKVKISKSNNKRLMDAEKY